MIERYTGDPQIIQKLGTNPEERGLTADEFKAKFDEFAEEFVAWFNTTHCGEVDGIDDDLQSHKAESANKHIHSSGSNASGSWIRYDNGIQICSLTATLTMTIAQTWGGMYFAGDTAYLPKSFVSAPDVSMGFSRLGGYTLLGGVSAVYTDRINFRLYAPVSLDTGTATVSFMAMGRWK